MEKVKSYFKIGAGLLIFLGLVHICAVFFISPDNEGLELERTMDLYKINLFGEHSFLKFHNGFSLTMGLLFSFLGLQTLVAGATAKDNLRPILLSSIFITVILFIVAIIYFHAFAYGTLAFVLLFFILSFVRLNKEMYN